MLYQNNASHMAQQWQRQVEESLEAGEALWLEGGLSQRAIDHIFTLTALATLARQRSDVTAPGLFVGGDGILWAAALMSRATDSADRSTPALTRSHFILASRNSLLRTTDRACLLTT